MKILALEAATQACSVALWLDGEVSQSFEIAPRRQAEMLLPMAQALLDDKTLSLGQLDAIAVGRGPGAFTGLRAVMGMAQGLGLATGLPVVGVSNLQALAAGAFRPQPRGQRCLVIQDARMGEVYWAIYRRPEEGEETVCDSIDAVAPPAELNLHDLNRETIIAGNAWRAIAELPARAGRDLEAVIIEHPQARDVASLAAIRLAAGEAASAQSLEPAYVRNNVAKKPGL